MDVLHGMVFEGRWRAPSPALLVPKEAAPPMLSRYVPTIAMRLRPIAVSALAVCLLLPARAVRAQDPGGAGEPTVSTFSILGFDPDSGELGIAVQSRVFSVGNGVIWAKAGVGAVATQAVANVAYGPRGLELLEQGLSPAEVVARLLEEDADPFPEGWPEAGRQVAVMDRAGRSSAWTGPAAPEWAGHRSGPYVSVQGNLLAGADVLGAMLETFQETRGPLPLRLLAALDAGQAAGGDRRGMQSAAMLVVRENAGPWLGNDVQLRLQVDDNPRPLAELRRLVELALMQRAVGQQQQE
jgi:uncharacterized Ntn-hydrolase superfamily protein